MAKKELNGIVIGSEDFIKGISDSAYLGFEELRNFDLDNEGVLQVSLAATKVSDSSGGDELSGMPKHIVKNPVSGYLYTLTDDQAIYFSTDNGASWGLLNTQPTSTGNGNGLIYWKDYLLVMADSRIDAFGPLSSGASWNNNTLGGSALTSDTFAHPSIHALDDKLYIGAGNKLVSITEKTGQTFNPTSSATYTLETAVITLPSGDRIRTINELGNRLILETWIDTSTRGARLYPYQHFAQASSYDTPIDLQEKGVRAALTVGNFLYVIAGDKGNIYLANSQEATLLKKLPAHLLDLNGNGLFNVYPSAIIYEKGKIYFGSQLSDLIGVWSYDIKSGRLLLEHEISSGSSSGTTTIGCLYPSIGSSGMLIGWFDGTAGNYGIDQVSGSTRYSTYKAIAKSAMYKVGTKDEPATFNKLEIQLAETTATGDRIRIGYRTVNSGSFTTIATLETEGITSYSQPVIVPNVENIQLQIETGGNTTILEIRLSKT